MVDGKIVKQSFNEVYHNVPHNVKASGLHGKKKRAMMIAIALSKARQRGAKV